MFTAAIGACYRGKRCLDSTLAVREPLSLLVDILVGTEMS